MFVTGKVEATATPGVERSLSVNLSDVVSVLTPGVLVLIPGVFVLTPGVGCGNEGGSVAAVA